MFYCSQKEREEERRVAKKRHRNIKGKRFEFGKHHHYHSLSFSVLDFVTVRKRKIFMLEWSSTQCMNSRCSVSSWTVENGFSHRYTTFIKEKAWFQKENIRGRGLITSLVLRTDANWKCIRAKTITSVSWKLGDNLFPAFVVFLT